MPARPPLSCALSHRLARRAVALLAAVAALLPALPAGAAPPAFPVNDVVETFFGTPVHDPYRALEDKQAPEVQAWMKAQDADARAQLAAIPGRQALLDTLLRLDAATPVRVVGAVRAGPLGAAEQWFYERRGATENQYKLYRRTGLQGAERLLVDPEALEKARGKPHAINWFVPSPDGRAVAYGLSAGGAEDAELNLLDTATGRALAAPVSRANFGGVAWTPDARQFVFTRLQAMKPGMPETDKFQNAQVLLMTPGRDAERAPVVFGNALPGVAVAPGAIPFVNFSHDGRWAFGLEVNGTQRELGLYLAPAAGVRAARPQWRQLFGAEAEVTGLAYMGNALYLLSHQGAPRFQVLRLDLGGRPDIARAQVVVPAGDQVITGLAAAADGLYLSRRDGNTLRLLHRPWAARGTDGLREVPLPVAGSFGLADDEGGASAADPRRPGVVIDLQGWTRARQIYQVTARQGARNTGLQPRGPDDAPDDIVATEVTVPSHDGARVPLSIIHRKGLVLDGSHPTLLYGYAAYGITEEPYYSPTRRAFIDAGGVLAIANPRGSSVYGEDWYRAGWQATKPNTWRDFIACAEWLVAQRYTAPARLGIHGGSAGGILVGRAMTERPDLFAAVVSQVGALDMVRAELTANGVPNIPEFGSRATEAGFRSLLAMSSYHQVKDGTPYPAVLLTHGVNDPRVEPWMSTKMAARLQAATSSGKPVLLRLDWDAGHGIGNTKRQQFEERADVYAFLLWRLGAAGFQPR